MGLPDVLVSDRDTRSTSAFWSSLRGALGASLIRVFGSPHHHNTTSKIERVDGVIADVRRSFPRPRQGRTFLATRDPCDPATLPTLALIAPAPPPLACSLARLPPCLLAFSLSLSLYFSSLSRSLSLDR